MQKQYFVHGLYSPMSFGDRPVYRSLQNDDIWIFKFQLTLSSSGSLSLGHIWGFCFHPFVRRKHEHWRARVLTFSRIPLTTRQKSNLPLCTLQMFFVTPVTIVCLCLLASLSMYTHDIFKEISDQTDDNRPACYLYTVSQKNNQNYFCYNYVKLPPNLTIFGTRMANCLTLYEVHSFSTSSNSC